MGETHLKRVFCTAEIHINVKSESGPPTLEELNLAAVLVEQKFNTNQKVVAEDEGLTAYPRVHIKTAKEVVMGTEPEES